MADAATIRPAETVGWLHQARPQGAGNTERPLTHLLDYGERQAVVNATPEEWRPVPEWDGYEVSSLGRVRSWKRRDTPLILSPYRNPSGYLAYHLSRPGRKQTLLVHHLVLFAFEGPRPTGLEIRHLDGNPGNNALPNLAYGTRSENTLDAVRHGTHRNPGSEKTHCKHGHEFTTENTYVDPIRHGRQCRTCRRDRDRRARRRKAT